MCCSDFQSPIRIRLGTSVNGYIYISGNPVTDPAKIAERAEFFQKRAGHYYQNWNSLYGRWREKMQALMAERNNHLPADRVMQFRLGVHMGDVIADEDEDANGERLEPEDVPDGWEQVRLLTAEQIDVTNWRRAFRAA